MAANPIIDRMDKRPGVVKKTPLELCEEGNARIAAMGRGHEIHWVLRDGSPNLEWKPTR